MAQAIPNPEPAGALAFLDCERLDVYRVAVEFQTIAARLVSNRRIGALRDQLDRASVSIVLCIAEGGATSERSEPGCIGVRPFSGSQSHRGKSQKPRSLDGRQEGNRVI